MSKKQESTYDKYIKSLSAQEKKDFEKEYRDLLLSEMLIAAMEQDNVSVRKLAKAAGVSPTIIQGIRSGTRSQVSMQSFFKILHALGYTMFVERNGNTIPLDFYSPTKK